jgi:cell shape-determining protein MreC
MDYIKVENHQNLVRDPRSGAIINKNRSEYDNYMNNYRRLEKERDELQKLKSDVSNLSSDMNEIKTLLKLLVEDKNYDD